ncbi:MAG: site-specific DNA-methyltransferase [Verrucomicrobiae bacterium]|nr:site-specific DNA-methyltransferase [Verrucomicrobiae bacterium]
MPTLNWIGKEAVVNHHHQVPFHLVKDMPDLSVGDPGGGNLIVQGDNLVALKALLPYYAGQVKCIYIDPPYNTGNENWIYNDNVNSPLIRDWLGKTVGKETEDLSRHDKWLCMMYPRLQLLRQFLHSEEGIIFVTIDDMEISNLRFIMNEIFGEQNWFATLVRRSMHTVRNSSKDFNLNVDYTLVYGRNKAWHGENKERYIRIPVDKTENYPFNDGDGKGRYKLDPLSARNFYTPYEYTFNNGIKWSASAGRYPAYSQETLTDMERENRIVFKGKEPKVKRYLKDVQVGQPPNALLNPEDVGFNSHGTTLLRDILGGGAFAQPKPIEFIKHLLTMIQDKNAIILDSFAGSGTTGHAVLSLNKQDGGNRKFILVEMEPNIARDITAERMKRVAEGYTNAKGEKVEGLGGGFRFCQLGEPLFDQAGKIRETVRFADLARHVYFTETGEPLPRERVPNSPLIGICRGVGIYLLFNGILGDKSANGGNILTRNILAQLPKFDGQKIIYCAGSLLGAKRLQAERILVRQTPYEIKVS